MRSHHLVGGDLNGNWQDNWYGKPRTDNREQLIVNCKLPTTNFWIGVF
ncbi:MAG: hypothetical protein QM305_11790 [Bacteroidota bacterium]|nr:hypothetical protein [Bacteroidota bacterium]